MTRIIRTDSNDPDFIELSNLLDIDIAERTPDSNAFFSKHNKINHTIHAIVIYDQGEPVSCGAIKEYDEEAIEIKRMFTKQQHRGKHYGRQVLSALEAWASELLFTKCILQTGLKHQEAIALYQRCGYTSIANYGQYVDDSESMCFAKSTSK